MSEPTFDDDPRPAREAELEDRVRRLEAALAERPAPDEVTDRVIARLSAIAAGREHHPDEGVLVLAAHPDPAVPPPPGTILQPPAAPVDPAQRKWFLAQLWAEIRLAAQMYFDPRYRVSRTTQFALPGLALVLIFNYFFFASWLPIPFLSPVLERLFVVVLAILGYKLFTRELARYREVREYLARYAR
jgi:hypothetical protein